MNMVEDVQLLQHRPLVLVVDQRTLVLQGTQVLARQQVRVQVQILEAALQTILVRVEKLEALVLQRHLEVREIHQVLVATQVPVRRQLISQTMELA